MIKWKKKQQIEKNTAFFKTLATCSAEEALAKLESSTKGLNEQEIEEKVKTYGKNIFSHRKFIWYKRLLHNLINPFILILIAITIYSFLSYFFLTNEKDSKNKVSDLASAIIVLIMICLSVFISYFQDYRSYKSAEKLNQLIETTASVYRFDENKQQREINLKDITSVAKETKEVLIKELVPGDIIFLSSGDMVPADVRLLATSDFFVNEASLTGESLPVEKDAKAKKDEIGKKGNILELQNLCFMGTNIVAGAAVAIVIATGSTSYFGNIAISITDRRPTTSFNKGVKKISYIIIAFMAAILPLIFIINALKTNASTNVRIWESLVFAVAVAVGITPEMLPMIISANLSRGALKLASKKVIVKNLSSIQNFGAMDILCTDKTGTLTEEQIELVKHLNPQGKESKKVLELAFFNSFFQTGLKNNIDKTIIQHINAHHYPIMLENYAKVDEIPFDFARRKMSVVIKKQDSSIHTLICKGALEEVLKICTKVEINEQIIELDDKIKKQILRLSTTLNNEGLRVIAVAYKEFPQQQQVFKITDEAELILSGYIGFLDVAKKSAISAIKALKEHGVAVKILTGDNEIVTKAICKKVGLDPKIPLLGSDIEEMSDTELKEIVDKTTIFAKMDPLQKARIIDVLKLKGHTVGFLGDGINDAVALHHADVGISVNSATDIAKEASDIILLEKDLDVLEQGIIGGRTTFGNILKYIKITISSNFGNCLSILAALIWLPFLPMIAIQVLLQNLLYDISQLTIPWDRVDKSFLKKPQKWENAKVIPFALWNGPLSSIFDILTFAFLWYGLKYNDPNNLEKVAMFQTGWFILGITSQTLIFNLLRTEKIPFFQSNATWQVLITNLVVVIIAIAIPYTNLGKEISFTNINSLFYFYLLAVMVAYFIFSQLWKILYIKVNKRWI